MISYTLILTLAGFLLGSLPFSVWVGQLGLRRDIREMGDHNPGATNVLRSGGVGWFVLALVLDISKGAITVGIATQLLSITNWFLLPIALAPSIGHAFSPLLQWRGGKAIATTFGVWIGLTIWTIPLISLILLIFWFIIQRNPGWAVMLTLIGLFFSLIWLGNPLVHFAVLGGQVILLGWTHRQDLRLRPQRRQFPWLSGFRNS